MIVRTQERRFAVVQVLRSTQKEEISVCRDLQEDTGALYTLARFRDPDLSCYLLPMLVQQRKNPAFEDFLDLFTQGGDLYACFRYTRAQTLAQRLAQGDLGLRERLAAGGSLLERMALLNMPPPLQYEALREQNVTLDESMTVAFNYVLESMTACFNADMGLVCIRVEEILRAVFAPELSARSVPELEDYLRRLERTEFGSYLEIYAAYDAVRQEIFRRTQEGAVEPQTWLFRLWAGIKRAARLVKPAVAGLVVVAAFCYLLYTMLQPAAPKGAPVLFDHIGTVEIRDGAGTAAP